MGGFHVIGINFKFILIYIFEEGLITSCIFCYFWKRISWCSTKREHYLIMCQVVTSKRLKAMEDYVRLSSQKVVAVI